MSYLVLARKWRPQNFDEIIGQDSITRTLKNAITSGRIAHAFLFSGPRGVGKTTMARVMAKALNCDRGPTAEPCGECPGCREITSGSSMDVLEIDGASNTSVDDIRDLREAVRYLPGTSRYKIYIIDEVHMLSINAFNALLKTLEEPPEHVIFIFATTEPHKVPATIQSRCLRFDFQRIPLKLIQERLKLVCHGEGIKIADAGLIFIAREAEGSMRDALSFLDQVTSFAGDDISEEQVIQTLGILERRYLYELSAAVLSADVKRALEIVNEVYQHGYDMKQFSRDMLEHFRNLAVVKYSKDPAKLMDLPEDEIVELQNQASGTGSETIQLLFDILARGEQEVARAREPKLLVEMTLAKMSSLKPVIPLEEVLKKLSALENKLRGSGVGHLLSSSTGGPDTGANPASQGGSESAEPGNRGLFSEENENPEHGSPHASGGTWPQFLKFAEKSNAKLAALLGHGTFMEKDGQNIKIAFPKDSFYLEQLSGKNSIKDLKRLTVEFFGEGCKIICDVQDEEASPGPSREDIQKEAEDMRREALENPLVQGAVDIFNAEIKEIKIK